MKLVDHNELYRLKIEAAAKDAAMMEETKTQRYGKHHPVYAVYSAAEAKERGWINDNILIDMADAMSGTPKADTYYHRLTREELDAYKDVEVIEGPKDIKHMKPFTPIAIGGSLQPNMSKQPEPCGKVL